MDIAELRQQLSSLDASEESTEELSDAELASFLHIQPSVEAAAKAIVAAEKWKHENGLTIKNVAEFLRSPPGATMPPGCLVCLEDGKGGVARDKKGRPIIMKIGMMYGSEEEMKHQLAYAVQRANTYINPEDYPDLAPYECCFVVEVCSRETGSLNATFRFPDANTRSLLDFMKRVYPGSQFSVAHFCGLPSFVVGSFKLVKPFVSKEIFDRLKLKSSFKHLKKEGYVEPASLISHWDPEGTFDFDLDRYVEWRAEEEGVPLDQICARGQGRSYNAKSEMERAVSLFELLGTADNREKILKHGSVEKKGSGVGLFASSRWKPKFLVLAPGMLLYFDSKKISDSNVASRLIPIGPSADVERIYGEEGKKAAMRFFCGEREYIFGFSAVQEAEEWTQALRKQISAAA